MQEPKKEQVLQEGWRRQFKRLVKGLLSELRGKGIALPEEVGGEFLPRVLDAGGRALAEKANAPPREVDLLAEYLAVATIVRLLNLGWAKPSHELESVRNELSQRLEGLFNELTKPSGGREEAWISVPELGAFARPVVTIVPTPAEPTK